MGQNAQTERASRGFITVDWMVLVAGSLGLLFLIATIFRVPVGDAAANGERFRELGGNDRLLAFQDFSFDADGWVPAATSDRLPGQGPVLGPFEAEPVQRSFAMPVGAASVQVSFDLHLLGDWVGQGAVRVGLGEQDVVTVELPSPDLSQDVAVVTPEVDGVRVAVQRAFVSPRAPEASLPGASEDFVTLRLRIAADSPEQLLTLHLQADVDGDARWTLDNLSVVATSGDGVQRR